MTDMASKISEETAWIKELETSAEEGCAYAQNDLAANLAQGYVVDKDEHGAFYWYCQSIKQGYFEAKYNAGSMLLDGDGGIPKNPELGMSLIEDAANTGDCNARSFIADCYELGLYGKEIDLSLSQQWRQMPEDLSKLIDFSDQLDLECEYGFAIKKPIIRYQSTTDIKG